VMRPRGGTSRGPAVTAAEPPTAAWRQLTAPGLSKFERDRRAILAMAGEFRTSFDFIETAGFTSDYSPAQPYQSWATERVDVIEDSGSKISLQHIIVMQYIDDEGDIQGPVVQKHWRQDWVYEDTSIHAYTGQDTWAETAFDAGDIAGRWSQAVFQVDDSPRYEAIGEWEHRGNYSAWTSDETWRPLPRRESGARSDYDVLIGTNRHVITPTGWVHEEDNLKVVLDPDAVAGQTVIAREVGVNRYEQIVDFDFSPGDDYWEATRDFWAEVRAEWASIYAEEQRFRIETPEGEPPLFQPMFIYAAELEAGLEYQPADARRFVRETLGDYVN
jgi:hypothetical protein